MNEDELSKCENSQDEDEAIILELLKDMEENGPETALCW